MPPFTTTIKCPNCSTPQPAAIEQVIDVAQDPAAKTRLLQGQLNFFVCPSCGFQGTLSTPLVYHDPVKELLLTFVPPEAPLTAMEQEKALGALIQQVMQSLPAEQRKGYLLRPQAVLTAQGLVERVLEADGITKEMLEQQRAKSRLVRELIEAEPDARRELIAKQDKRIDADVLALISVIARSASAQKDEAFAKQALAAREDVLHQSTAGKRSLAQQEEMDHAARDLQGLGKEFNIDSLVRLVAAAPSLDRVTALAALAWQVMDYSFFQRFTENLEKASGTERERLTAIRDRALLEVQRVQQAVQSEMNLTAGVLQSILQAPDLDAAVEQYLPECNDLFFAILEANLETARREKQEENAKRLEEVKTKIFAALEKSLPPELRLLRELLEKETDEQAEALLSERAAEITEAFVSALKHTVEDLESGPEDPRGKRMKRLLELAEKQLAMAKFAGK
ncbi:MAG: CpXC domain-containing protein [Anaerolineales bacterium]